MCTGSVDRSSYLLYCTLYMTGRPFFLYLLKCKGTVCRALYLLNCTGPLRRSPYQFCTVHLVYRTGGTRWDILPTCWTGPMGRSPQYCTYCTGPAGRAPGPRTRVLAGSYWKEDSWNFLRLRLLSARMRYTLYCILQLQPDIDPDPVVLDRTRIFLSDSLSDPDLNLHQGSIFGQCYDSLTFFIFLLGLLHFV